MSNYKDFLIGAGGGGAYIPPYEQTWNLVAAADGYIVGSSYTQQSSTTYQSFHRLSEEGLYGGIFDPNNGSSGYVYARAFTVNQSTGAISVAAGQSLWSHSYGNIFSTGHHGGIGNNVMYIGHAKNPSYGSTNKGYIYAAEFNNDGTVDNYGNGQAPFEAWPHSNGDLVMNATAKQNGTTYGRRSTYNQNTGTYYHSQGYHSNGSVSYQEWSNISSSTSTNYAVSAIGQTKQQLDRGGMVAFKNSSGQSKFNIVYGSNGSRSSDYDFVQYFGHDYTSTVTGFCVSTGETIWVGNTGKCFKSNNSNGTVTQLTGSSAPSGVSLLTIVRGIGENSWSNCIPLGNDTWIFPMNGGGGWIRLSIDVNNGYAVSADYLYSGLLSPAGDNPSHSGWTYDITGTNQEYFVMAKVASGAYDIKVFDNPFYGV